MIKKTSGLMTTGGVLAAFGTSLVGIPLVTLQYYAQIVKDGPPHWFNVSILPMMLCGLIMTALGTAIMGVAGKGADDHSTMPQMEAATTKAAVEQKVMDANVAATPAPPQKVIVEPKAGE